MGRHTGVIVVLLTLKYELSQFVELRSESGWTCLGGGKAKRKTRKIASLPKTPIGKIPSKNQQRRKQQTAEIRGDAADKRA